MIWKSLAALAGAVVLVIAVNGVGNLVFDANTPAPPAEPTDSVGEPLSETPTVTETDTAEVEDVEPGDEEADTVTVETPRQPMAVTTQLGDDEASDQPITEQQTAAAEAETPAQDEPLPMAGEQVPPGDPAAQEMTQDVAAGGPGLVGDPEAGKKVARTCVACHTFDEGGPHRVGPNLWNIVGADIASQEGYNYSEALTTAEGEWTVESLSAWLANPNEFIPGNKMTFAGIKDADKRQDLIAYMQTLQ